MDLGGTVRECDPRETLERARRAGRALGVTRLANVTGLDHVGVPVWVAIRPLAWSLTVSQGKGISDELAMASALMESIELAHAETYRGDGPRRPLTWHRHDPRFLPPAVLPLSADAEPRADQLVHWVRATTIAGDDERFVPADLFRLDFRDGDSSGPFLCTSNGLASGNSLAEAVLHGLCEVIERDQVSFAVIANSIGGARHDSEIDLVSIDDPVLVELAQRIEQAGLWLRAWHATTTVDVPAFIALVHGPRDNSLYPIRAKGFGAHPCKRVALGRAITEALQSRLTYIAGSRDDRLWTSYADSRSANVAELDARRDEPPPLDYRRLPEYHGPLDTDAMLRWVEGRMRAAGLERALVVDLRRDDLGIPVAWVFVPELEHHGLQPDYLPGRRMLAFLDGLAGAA